MSEYWPVSLPVPGAAQRVIEAARAVVLTWRKDDPQYVRSSDLMDDIDVLEVALAAFVGSEEPSGTSDRQSFSEGALRVGAPVGSSVPAGRWAADAEHDALVDLLLACGLMLERRDAQGRGAARARLRESMAAAQKALGLDAPLVVKCAPVRPEVTLHGGE